MMARGSTGLRLASLLSVALGLALAPACGDGMPIRNACTSSS